MRDLFQQDRAVSPATVRTAILVIGALFAGCLGLIIFLALLGMFGIDPQGAPGRLFAGLLQIGLSAGALLAIYMIVRLLGEILTALHRLNDRMTILSDEMRSVRGVKRLASKATKTPAAKPAADTNT